VRETSAGKIATILPNREELKVGTLKRIFELARISEKEFAEAQ